MNTTHPITRYLETTGTRVGDFARAVKTSRQTIYRLIHGKQTPSIDLASRLSQATAGAVTANDFMVSSVEERATCAN